MRRVRWLIPAAAMLAAATPAAARDALGIWNNWGAFRDPGVPRCYAIARAERTRGEEVSGYLAVGTWPRSRVRGQVHVHLSHPARPGSRLLLNLGGVDYPLAGARSEAWLPDARGDAAVVAAMRSAEALRISGTDTAGRPFTDRYALPGVASALDAAAIGCAG